MNFQHLYTIFKIILIKKKISKLVISENLKPKT